MRIYLIDGYSLLYRAFYALPQSIATSGGLPTNAMYGFTSMLLRLLADDTEELGVGVVWDAGAPRFRLEVYPEYKAQRSAMPDELREQVGHMDEILSALNIPTLRAEGFEADDVLATLSRSVPEGVELQLVTGDQDAMQLVGESVRVLRTTKGVSETKLYGREEVIEDYGVTPEQIPDYKALTGDTSDNIPGVRGIGPKSAVKLLAEFGTVGELYENLDSVSAKGTRSKLAEGRESAFMSLELARMRFDAPVEFDAEALRFEGVSPRTPEVMRRYEFRTLGNRVAELPVVGGAELKQPERVRLTLSEEPVEPGEEPVAVAPVAGAPGSENGRWCVAVAEDTVRLVDEPPDRPKIVHDAKRAGVRGAKFDTYLAAYLIQPGTGSYDPEAVADVYRVPEVEVAQDGEGANTFGAANASANAVATAARRAALVYSLAPALAEDLEEHGLASLYYEVELPLADVLSRMQRVGMPVNREVLGRVGEEIEGEMESSQAAVFAEAGHEFNINSPKQLSEVLFEEMSLPPVRKTKTGYSTDAKVLQQLALEHPIADHITRYRELAKLKGTYIDGLSGLITAEGRIHTTLNQTTTATGRISSDSPNLQNIPIRSELGARIRDAFTASEGRELVVADYSQIELRILAHMTREPALLESFKGGEDVHTRTAAEVFDVRPESVTPELRRRAKMVNFGILYGISGFGLATRLGNVHPKEAEQYIQRYLERYPKVTEFMQSSLKEAEERGYVTTLFGRRRYVPELKDSNRNVRKFGERAAFNARVQGTAADIIKVAMVDLAPRLAASGADLLMQVHDELVFDVERDRVEEVIGLATRSMVAAYDLDPPLEVEVKVGQRWGSAEQRVVERG